MTLLLWIGLGILLLPIVVAAGFALAVYSESRRWRG